MTPDTVNPQPTTPVAKRHRGPVRDAAVAHLACVVPMYNEGAHAGRFLHALHAYLAPRFGRLTIVVVDDGSRDATRDQVLAAIEEGLPVHLLRLSRNFGKEIALTAGLDAVERLPDVADAVLIIDADFQHPFETIQTMVARWQAGVDMVYGVQTRRADAGPARRLLTWLFYRLLRSSDDSVTIPADAGDFRLMDRRVVQAINRLPERSRYMKGLYAWVGFTSEGVPFEAAPRPAGASSFGVARLARLALDGVTAFTTWPLRVASVAGFILSLAAFAYTAWIVIERLFIGQPIPGFATLAAAIMFFSGVQLLSVGILGEYLGRVFLEVKSRPLFLVAEEVDGGTAPREDDPGSLPAESTSAGVSVPAIPETSPV